MKMTDNRRAMILNAMRSKKLNNSELAAACGRDKSWPTRLFDGSLKSIDDEIADKLEDLLGIQFHEVIGERPSEIAIKIEKLMEGNEDFREIVALLLSTWESPKSAVTPRFLTTKELSKLGHEVTQFVFANEGKAGKIGRYIVEHPLLSDGTTPNKKKK